MKRTNSQLKGKYLQHKSLTSKKFGRNQGKLIDSRHKIKGIQCHEREGYTNI